MGAGTGTHLKQLMLFSRNDMFVLKAKSYQLFTFQVMGFFFENHYNIGGFSFLAFLI
jgi:hypothetical protein